MHLIALALHDGMTDDTRPYLASLAGPGLRLLDSRPRMSAAAPAPSAIAPALASVPSKSPRVAAALEARARRHSQICFLKMLLPEREVGNVIGKGGALLKKICEDSGARVHISAIDEVIPVTRERVATISGRIGSLTLAQHLISKALSDVQAPHI